MFTVDNLIESPESLSNSSNENDDITDGNLEDQTTFATTLLLIVYTTMFVSILLLFIRITYVAYVRSLDRPIRSTPSFIMSSSDGPTNES